MVLPGPLEVEELELHARKIILAFNQVSQGLCLGYFLPHDRCTRRTSVMVNPEIAASSATGAATR